MQSLLICLVVIGACYAAEDTSLTEVPDQLLQECGKNVNGSLKGVKFDGTCENNICTLPTGRFVSFQLTFIPDLDTDFFFIELDITNENESSEESSDSSIDQETDALDSCDSEEVTVEGGSANCSLRAGITYTVTLTKRVARMSEGKGNVTIAIEPFDEENQKLYMLACSMFPYTTSDMDETK